MLNSIVGTQNSDFLPGTTGNDDISGLEGDDIIIGTTGNDVINGGDGFDTVDYSDLGQAVTLLAKGEVDNGSQSQVSNIENFIGAIGQENSINGEAYADTGAYLEVDLSTNFLRVNNTPNNGTQTFEVENFVNVTGAGTNDTLSGNDEANELTGNGGGDILGGAGGDDVLDGGGKNDTLEGGTGNDTLIGSEGNDLLVGGDGDDVLIGGEGKDRVEGGGGSDTFILPVESGTDAIVDFELDNDILALSGGVSFDDLTASGDRLLLGDRALATFQGLEASALTADNFTSV